MTALSTSAGKQAAGAGVHRRAFALGLTTMGLVATGMGVSAPGVLAQEAPSPAPPARLEALLLTNLLTRMAVAITINGRDDLLFVLDTGAERTTIDEDVAVALGLPAGPSLLIHGVTSAERTPSVDIARLDFGGLTFRDIRAPVISRRLLGADGLLGLDVLSRFRFDLSVATHSVELTPTRGGPRIRSAGGFSRSNRPNTLRARRSGAGQLILMGAQADEVPIDIFVDSGAQYSIGNMALRNALARRDPRMGRQPVIQVFGVTGQTLNAEPGRLRQLTIGRAQLGPTPMLFADLYAFSLLGLGERPAILIGADVMSRFRRISLDFPNSRAAFEGVTMAAGLDLNSWPRPVD